MLLISGNLQNLIGLLTAFLLSFGIYAAKAQTSQENLTKLKEIEESIDHTVDPCDNFYHHACGKWSRTHMNDSYTEIMTRVMSDFERVIDHQIFGNYAGHTSGQSFMDKAFVYYRSCMEAKWDDLFGYLNVLKPGPGLEWPFLEELQAHQRQEANFVLRSWPAGKFQVFPFLGQMHSYGIPNEVVKAEINQVKNGTVTITLSVPAKSDLDAYRLARILTHRELPDRVQDKYFEEILSSHEYWQEVYSEHWAEGETRHLSYGQLRHLYPQLAVLVAHIRTHPLSDEDRINFENFDYYEFLLAKQWQPFEAQKLCNYMIANFLISKMSSMSCAFSVFEKMPLAVDFLYYKHAYVPKASAYNPEVSLLAKNIIKHLVELLEENHLDIPVEVLQQLKSKVRSTVTNFGNLPENVTQAMVEEFYRNLPALDPQNYYKNELLLTQYSIMKSDRCFQDMTCNIEASIFPYYVYARNLVAMSLAMFQMPMYHIDLDPVFVFSGLGFFMGHEYVHAIDSNSLAETYGKSLKTDKIFTFITCAPETEEMGELIADLVGARVAYRAYSREHHPYVNYSQIPWQKLFFLNMAQFFCSKGVETALDHDSDETRINNIAMHLDSFAEAFQCPADSRMNPSRKCRFY